MHDVNVHWLELVMIAEEVSMEKATLKETLATVLAAQLHDLNVHWLELAMVAGEDFMKKA